MTDIKLRRRRRPIWPWLAGVLILVALGWGVVEVLQQRVPSNHPNAVGENKSKNNSHREFAFADEKDLQETNRNIRNIEQYMQFVTESEAYVTGNAFEAEGLSKLADALESLAIEIDFENKILDTKLESVRNKSKYILVNGNVHSDSVRVAIEDAVDVFEIMQLEKFPNESRKVDALENIINRYSTTESERKHRKDIQEFFNQSAFTIEAFSMKFKENQMNN
jgi:hypothetical protein